MIEPLRIVRSIVVTVGVTVITVLALLEGADAGFVGTLGLLTLGAHNGIRPANAVSLLRAIRVANDDAEDDANA